MAARPTPTNSLFAARRSGVSPYCADATTLAFVDGTFGPDGITFEITYVNAAGSTAYKDRAIAKFSQGRLIVTGTSGAPGGGRFERVLIKDPRGPEPLPVIVSVLPKVSEHLIHAFLVRVVTLEAFNPARKQGAVPIVLDFTPSVSPCARTTRRPVGQSCAVAIAPA